MVKVLIEAKQDSNIRSRFNEQTLMEESKRILRAKYPYSYGFIVGTNRNNEDALDCFIVSKNENAVGEIVECEIVDGFIFDEDDEKDIKMIGILKSDKTKYNYKQCWNIIKLFLCEIFLEWPEISIRINNLFGKNRAIEIINIRNKSKEEKF